MSGHVDMGHVELSSCRVVELSTCRDVDMSTCRDLPRCVAMVGRWNLSRRLNPSCMLPNMADEGELEVSMLFVGFFQQISSSLFSLFSDQSELDM